MANLTTNYLGMTLRNPVLVSSCTHTITPDSVSRLEDAGAGAVVLKSIFEEQIRADVDETYGTLESDLHPEAYEYLRADLPMQFGPEKYLERVHAIKERVSIPVIASLNCVNPERWLTFARRMEAAGADALELNIYDVPTDASVSAGQLEQRHVELVRAVRGEVRVPLAVKIGSHYSAPAHFAAQLEAAGAGALVLFNRFLQPDLDIDSAQPAFRMTFSRPSDMLLPLRWTAILRPQLRCDLSLTTGVHTAEGALKAIMAGADTVQVCSVLYSEGFAAVSRIVEGIAGWMNDRGYGELAEVRARAAATDRVKQAGFERAQYVRALVGME